MADPNLTSFDDAQIRPLQGTPAALALGAIPGAIPGTVAGETPAGHPGATRGATPGAISRCAPTAESTPPGAARTDAAAPGDFNLAARDGGPEDSRRGPSRGSDRADHRTTPGDSSVASAATSSETFSATSSAA